MNRKIRAFARLALCVVLYLGVVGCEIENTNRSLRLAEILEEQGVSVTNTLRTVPCRSISLKQDENGFTVFIENGSIADVKSFLEAALADSVIDLGKDNDGFETAALHKSASHLGLLIQAKPKGVELIGIK
jgi:hypothetical protein